MNYFVFVHVTIERGYRVEADNEEMAKMKVIELDDNEDIQSYEYERIYKKKIDHVTRES